MYVVGVVGLGGTGCEIIRALLKVFKAKKLAGTQVKLLIVDRDTVARANLGKQALYGETAVGLFKADSARTFIEARGYQVESYATDAARPAFIQKLRAASSIFVCVDNVHARRKVIPALLLTQRLVVDVGTEGLAGSIRLYLEMYPCFHCTSWMYATKTRPLCSVPGIPCTAEDCILIAAHTLLEGGSSRTDQATPDGSHDSAIAALANELSTMHNIEARIEVGDVSNTLQQIVPTPFHISALVATYAVSIWTRHYLVPTLEGSQDPYQPGTYDRSRWPTECFWMLSMYNGLHIQALELQRDENCHCSFTLPGAGASGEEPTYESVLAAYYDSPDLTIVANERIVYSPLLLNQGEKQLVPSKDKLEGVVLIYADKRLQYATWVDYAPAR